MRIRFAIALLLSGILFLALLALFPSCGQHAICTVYPYCDYRCFISPCIQSQFPYSPTTISPKDACYPPVAYLCTMALTFGEDGLGWEPAGGELMYFVSLFIAQLLAVILLSGQLQRNRYLGVVAALLSPVLLSSLYRGNPSAWSFALIGVFVCWFNSESHSKRIIAALCLGLATALKITPCIWGMLYIAEAPLCPRQWRWGEIVCAAAAALFLIVLPFYYFGGFGAISDFISNACENAKFHSLDNPTWGFVNIVNRFEWAYSKTGLAVVAAYVTRFFAAALVVASCLVKDWYRKLLFLGAAMAFLTHYEYGGAYLIPAFFTWIGGASAVLGNRVVQVLESVAWFLIMTPLQIPQGDGGSLNSALMGESLFLLLCLSLFAGAFRQRTKEMGLENGE